jgi:hypothetical protein
MMAAVVDLNEPVAGVVLAHDTFRFVMLPTAS